MFEFLRKFFGKGARKIDSQIPVEASSAATESELAGETIPGTTESESAGANEPQKTLARVGEHGIGRPDLPVGHLERFDHIVANSTHASSVRTTEASSNTVKTEQPVFEYDSKCTYNSELIHALMCSPIVDQNSKLDFMRKAIANHESEVMRNFPTRCACVSEQPALAKLLDEHWRRYVSKAGPDEVHKTYNHFEFLAFNNLRGSAEQIKKYFAERPKKEQRYPYEASLPHCLISYGETDEALAITRMLMQELENGEHTYLAIDNFDRESDLFTSLYFAVDDDMKTEVGDLAFQYCRLVSTGFWRTSLERLLQRIDQDRYREVLAYHLDRIEIEGMDDKGTNRRYTQLISGKATESLNNDGERYWQRYLKCRSMFEPSSYGPPHAEFERCLLHVANSCARHIESDAKKHQLVDDVINNHRHLRADSEERDLRLAKKFVELLVSVFPAISTDEIVAKIPERYAKDLNTLRRHVPAARTAAETNARTRSPVGPSLKELLTLFQSYGYHANVTLSAHGEFIGALKSSGRHAHRLINDTGNTLISPGDLGEYPVRYDHFYNGEILPLLNKNSVNAPILEQLNEEDKTQLSAEFDKVCVQLNRLENDDEERSAEIQELRKKQDELLKAIGVYTLSVTSDTKTRQIDIVSDRDSYQIEQLCHVLNLALADNQSNVRIMQMHSGDPISWLGIFNPEEILPLLHKLDIYCYANTFDDGLMTLNPDFVGYY